MASPPITVGELIDVPAPESPINAAFMQEIANRIVHRFATVPAMDASALANGSVASVAGVLYHRVGGASGWVALATVSAVVIVQAQVTATQANNWVTTPRIVDGAVTTAKIADGTIVAADLAAAVLNETWVSEGSGNFAGEEFRTQRQGNVVHLQYQGTVVAAGTSVSYISTEAHRPAGDIYLPGSNMTTGAAVTLVIHPNGDVFTVATLVPGNVLCWSGVYPVP